MEGVDKLVLNADVRLTRGCVAELLRGLRTPGTGIAVPKLTDRRGELIYSMRHEPTLTRQLLETILPARTRTAGDDALRPPAGDPLPRPLPA